jgi:hypothetical protein
LRAQDQLVQLLPMLGFNDEARADVLVHKGIVEDDDVGHYSIPRSVPEDGGRWPARAIENYVRGIVRAEAAALVDR